MSLNLDPKHELHRWADDGGPAPGDEIQGEMDRVFGPRSDGGLSVHAHEPREHHAPIGDAMVILPKHYSRFQIEPVHFTVTNKLDLLESNVVKYTLRAPYKHSDNGRQDYLKAIRCLVMKAKQQAGDPDWWKPYNTDLGAILEQEIPHGPSPGS